MKMLRDLKSLPVNSATISVIQNNLIKSSPKNILEYSIEELREHNEATSVQLIKVKGNGYARAIQIDYSGDIYGNFLLPDTWVGYHSNNKIIMLDLGYSPLDIRDDVSIIGFSGNIKIIKAVVVDYNTLVVLIIVYI